MKTKIKALKKRMRDDWEVTRFNAGIWIRTKLHPLSEEQKRLDMEELLSGKPRKLPR